MSLYGSNPERLVDTGPDRQLVRLGDEDRIGDTVETGPDIRPEIVDRADEELVLHEEVGHDEAEDDGADPSTYETFDCLLGRDLDQLGSAERDSADVSEDIVGDNKRSGQEHPDHAFEHVVHGEVSLYYDKVQRHMGPGELSELKLVLSFLE